MLQDAGAEVETSNIREIRWTDMLASHGVAVGMKGLERVVVAVVPGMKRTVQWTGMAYASPTALSGPTGTHPLDVTFPPLLAMLRVKELRYTRAYLFCVKADALKTVSVQGEAPVLASFPYGNVYAAGGKICWGTVGHASVNTIEDLLHVFFTSGFNQDLFTPTPCGSRARNLWEMHQAVQPAGSGVVPAPVAAYYTMGIAPQLRRLLGSGGEE